MGGLRLSDNNEIKRNNKDSFFRRLFSNGQHFLDLYRACSGNQLSENDITPFDLGSEVVNRPLINDVSFLTKDNRLLILVEHTSTPNPNMPQRDMLYYAELVRQWLTQEGKDLSARGKVDIPLPEFYIAYNGKSAYNENRLTFGNEFLSIKAKLLDINFKNLQHQQPSDSLAGYSYFYYQRDIKKAEGASGEQAFDYAVQQCKRDGYLKGVVDKEDFIVEYRPLFSREDDLRYEGELIGEARGEAKGVVKMLHAAVKAGVPDVLLQAMIKDSGFDTAQADEIIKNAQQGILFSGGSSKTSVQETIREQRETTIGKSAPEKPKSKRTKGSQER